MSEELSFLRQQARSQRFTLGAPKQFRVSAHDSTVLFLRSASGVDARNSLWTLDPRSGEVSPLVDASGLPSDQEDLPPEERARRERARDTSSGVGDYSVDDAFSIAVFSVAGTLHLVDLRDGSRRVLVDSAVIDPRPSPTGTHIAYVQHGRLRVLELTSDTDRELVGEDNTDITWGLAEFIAAEEMGRSHGYWWAPDGRSLLVQRSDHSAVPRWHIADPAHPDAPVNTVAYPAAGTTNATVSLSILGLDGSRVDVEQGDWEYLASVHWSAGGPPLMTVQPRDQRRLEVYAVDPVDGSTSFVHAETDPNWVEIPRGVPAWTTDGRLVRVGVVEDSYRLLIDGTPVTGPELQVRAVLDVGDEVLFSASGHDPTQLHVYRTTNGTIQQLSTTDGFHVGSGTAELTVLSSWSLHHSGPTVSVLADGVAATTIDSYTLDPGVEPDPEWLTVGERNLRAALLLPHGYRPDDGALPVLLDPYGGPHAQRVLQSRNAFLTSQWLADQGFAVLVADGRGTPGRGVAWERDVAGRLAEVTLADQVDALHAVAAHRPEVLDLERVAIRGWSYGGYLAALAVLRRPDVFHAAVAGAPVTDWSLYDTHYTERYLGHPKDEPEVYRHNSLLDEAANLCRALLITHGLGDDNVFVAHALRLSAALQASGRPHTFLPLVGTTHMTPQAEEVAENLLLTQIAWIKRELEE